MAKNINNKQSKSIALGLCFGVLLGVLTGNIALWIGVGLCFGVAFGNQSFKKKNEN